VENTVGNQDIGSNNTSVVDKDTSVVDGDGQVGAVHRFEQSSVLQSGAVTRRVTNDSMVGEDASDLVSCEVGKTTGNGLESSVVWGKEGNVGRDWLEVGRVECTAERSQSSSGESFGVVYGKGENMVDDVDHATGEVDVLRSINTAPRLQG
jgi:hypothetical protein